MENCFYFMFKAKWLYKKAKINFRIYDVTDWDTSNYNTHFAQYIKK